MRRRPARELAWSVTLILIVVNVAMFVLQNVVSPYGRTPFYRILALSAEDLAHGWVWQLLTYQFLHAPLLWGGLLHVLGNCLTIYVFGHAVEAVLGKWRFLGVYLIGGVVGGLLQAGASLVWPHLYGGYVVGASAGAFGLVAAFAVRFPDQLLTLFFLPIEVRARVLIWVSLALTALGIAFPAYGGQVAHWGHLGGMLTGLLYMRMWVRGGGQSWYREPPARRREAARPVAVARARQEPARTAPPRTPSPAELAPADFMSQEVDPILDKISAHGIQSLTDRERQILEQARKKLPPR